MSEEGSKDTVEMKSQAPSKVRGFLKWSRRVLSAIFKELRIRKLRVMFAIVIVGLLSIALTSILFWVSKGIFGTNLNDPISLGIFVFVFGLFGWVVIATDDLQSIGLKKSQNYFDSKLSRYSLENRYLFRVSLFRIGLILSLGTFWYGFFATYAGQPNSFFIDIFLVGIVLSLISSSLISDKSISLFFFRKFRDNKRKNVDELAKALNRFNRSVDFRISSKNLSFICQYVEHVYSLDLKDCKEIIDANLGEVIKSLEEKRFDEIPKTLLKISSDCDDFLEKYKSLGIEIKPSRWIKAKETLGSSIPKVVPNLIWLMILFAVGFILRGYIPIEISFR